MSHARDLLSRAQRAPTTAAAERLATEAIMAEPDLGPAYGLRGALAARRGDPIAAAHYFRVAYARGDRSATTRAGLAACLTAAGDQGAAQRIRAGARLPSALSDFEELVLSQGPVLRQVLSSRLPPAGQPALLQGERAPEARPAEPRSARAGEAQVSQSVEPRASRPPASAPSAPRRSAAPTPAADMAGSPGPRGRRRRAIEVPDWLESTHVEAARPSASATTPSWLENNSSAFDRAEGSGRFTGGSLDLTEDPGTLSVVMRSPVTGRPVSESDLRFQRSGAQMPQFGVRVELFEARQLVEPLIDPEADLRFALYLPGAVMTTPGGRPQKLADRIALGLTEAEVLMVDTLDSSTPPARVPLRAVAGLDVVGDDQQASVQLKDGRQLHFDLRRLREAAPMVAQRALDLLDDAVTRQDQP